MVEIKSVEHCGHKKLVVTCLIKHLFFASSYEPSDRFVIRNYQDLKPAKRHQQHYNYTFHK